MIKLDPSITDPKAMARRIAELHDRVEQLEAEIKQLREAARLGAIVEQIGGGR